jgi:hypothetical protein
VNLVDLVLAVHRTLEEHGLSHAFGGALALAYVGEPRATVDVDVNVFLPASDLDVVASALEAVSCREARDPALRVPNAGVRFLHRDTGFPVDVFPSLDVERYAEIERRVVRHPFGPDDEPLPFLSPEDLVVFKLSFGRDKDWVDLRAMARTGVDLDVDLVEAQLIALRGPSLYPRVARLRSLLRTGGA